MICDELSGTRQHDGADEVANTGKNYAIINYWSKVWTNETQHQPWRT